jgi:hypothetical protein
MSFQYKKSDPRGFPLIKKIDGKWEVLYDYSTTTELVKQALYWVEHGHGDSFKNKMAKLGFNLK